MKLGALNFSYNNILYVKGFYNIRLDRYPFTYIQQYQNYQLNIPIYSVLAEISSGTEAAPLQTLCGRNQNQQSNFLVQQVIERCRLCALSRER